MTHTKKKWWILFVTASATALVFLDQTIMPVALPVIQKQFGFSEVGLVWVVNTYLLVLMALLLIGGRLAEIFGNKRIYLVGLSLFGLASIMGGMSMSQSTLLLARCFQGAAAALTMPTTAALLIKTFPPGLRARAIGINVGISAIFLALGPVVGGFVTQYLSWRIIFLVNLPIIAFGIIMSLKLLDWEKPKHKEPFHLLGALAIVFAVSTFVVAVMQGNDWGWSSPEVITLLVMSPFCWAVFVFLSLKESYPLIDFKVFRSRAFTGAVLTIFMTQLMISVTVFWAIFFQNQLGFSPAKTGVIILIAIGPVFFIAPLAGYLADRLGHRVPMITGFLMLIVSLGWIAFTVGYDNLFLLVPGLIGFGAGMPMIFSPALALALSNVPVEKLGSSSAVTTAARQLAATTGISLMTAVYQATILLTGSHVYAFSVISLLACFFAILGLMCTLFVVQKGRS